MKKLLDPKNLPWLTLIAGAVGLLLRLWHYSTAAKTGFLTRWHISAILLYLLTAAFLVVLIAGTRSLTQANKYQFNFPASTVGGLAAAAALVITAIGDLMAGQTIATVVGVLGIITAVCLALMANARWKGLHPSPLFHILCCLYLTLRLFYMYRSWSSDPQLQDFCFQILALVCLMLSAYHRATFDANFGKRHSYVFFSLAAVFFCCLSLGGPDHILFYLGCGFWQITDLCNLTPMPQQRERRS